MNSTNNHLLVPTAANEVSSNIIGNIDGVFGASLAGWFYCEADSDESTLTLFVDGVESNTVKVNESRPDVSENLGFGGNSGFTFDLSSIEIDGVVELSVKHRKSGYDFFSQSFNYSSDVHPLKMQIAEILFPQYYRAKYGLASLNNEDVLHHYMSEGIYSDFNPNPWFDVKYYRKNHPSKKGRKWLPVIDYLQREASRMELQKVEPEGDEHSEINELMATSELFDPQHYLAMHQDLKSMTNLLGHYVQFGHYEGRSCVERRVPDHIRNELEVYQDIEPALLSISNSIDWVVRYPIIKESTYLPEISELLFKDQIEVVICVPFITVGGADLLATYLARAYEQQFDPDSVLIIVTNSDEIEVQNWVDSSTNVLLLEKECNFADKEDKISTLHRIVSTLAPQKIINVNSNECWEMFRNFGAQLSSVLNLYAYAFCFDYDIKGRRAGYIPEYIPDVLRSLTKVFCDNSSIIQEIREIYGFSDDVMQKFHTLYSPLPSDLPLRATGNTERNKKILWAGRLAHQKRPDLLVKIASALANETFVVFGPAGNSKVSDDIIAGRYKNIEYQGVFSDISEIDLDEYFLYLNTSQWDGIPTMLLLMCAVGMPIVTSDVGGIGEVVDDSTGWVVKNAAEAQDYITTLRMAIVNFYETEQRALHGAARTRKIHSWDNYIQDLMLSGAFSEREELPKNLEAAVIHNDISTAQNCTNDEIYEVDRASESIEETFYDSLKVVDAEQQGDQVKNVASQ